MPGIEAVFCFLALVFVWKLVFVSDDSLGETSKYPWFSCISMLYPIASIVNLAKLGAPTIPALGYGFGNLGYLLFGAGLLAGRFGFLGFRTRMSTIIAAIVVFLIGTLISTFYTNSL
jgi:hypothetical protein